MCFLLVCLLAFLSSFLCNLASKDLFFLGVLHKNSSVLPRPFCCRSSFINLSFLLSCDGAPAILWGGGPFANSGAYLRCSVLCTSVAPLSSSFSRSCSLRALLSFSLTLFRFSLPSPLFLSLSLFFSLPNVWVLWECLLVCFLTSLRCFFTSSFLSHSLLFIAHQSFAFH